MSSQENGFESTRPCEIQPPTGEELAAWKEMIRRMPEVRVDKVQAVRDALRSNQYDERLYFEKTIAALSEALSIS